MWIEGQPCQALDGAVFLTLDPYTGKAWAEVPRASATDVDRAVTAAHRQVAGGEWSTLTASARGRILHSCAEMIRANAEDLAAIEVRDNGKLLTEMRGQVHAMAEWFQYYAGLADKVEGCVTPADAPDILHYVRYEPLGVIAAIIPWNAPLLLTAFKLAPALAAGNAVVIKPSEHAPASTLALARCLDRAGLPAGVVNVVTGYPSEIGEPLISHPMIAKVAFTGGELGGRTVYESAARGLKPASLELGGKTPAIVFDDADMKKALAGSVRGIFAGAGQTCMASSRLLLHAPIYDEFVERLVALTGKIKLGDPRLPDTDMGPIATEAQFEKILADIEAAKSAGADCVAGGKRSSSAGTADGWFVEPTIFAGVSNTMTIARNEIFGPVLCVLKFETEDEAIEIANDSPFGLAAAVWTSSLRRALELPARLQAGTVWVNTCRLTSHKAPFGGVKKSGFGREGGVQNMHSYLAAKSVFITH